MVVVGLPGILLALVVKLVIKEPRTLAAMRLADRPKKARASLSHELAEIQEIARELFGRWPILNVILGTASADDNDKGLDEQQRLHRLGSRL